MEFGKLEVREGSVDWKIDGFLKNKNKMLRSNIFKLYKGDFRLIINGILPSCNVCSVNRLVFLEIESCCAVLGDNVCLKLWFIGCGGEKYFKMKSRPFKFFNNRLVLMVIRINELNIIKEDIFHEGSSTLRLSWSEEHDKCAETSDPFDGIMFRNPGETRYTEYSKKGKKEFYCNEMSSTSTDLIHLLKLSKDLVTFYERRINTDCVLRVDTMDYPAHRAVLSARSEVFAAMFHHDTSENRSGVVDITDVNISVMGDVLYYIYSGQIRGITIRTAALMYAVADKYALIEFRDACTNFLENNITFENVCDVAVIAHTYAEQKLEDKVINFIEENSEELLENITWTEFSKKNTLLACKYLHAALVASKKANLKIREKIN